MSAEAATGPSPFERWRSATLAPFQHRVFALFWWASLVSSFGSLIQTVGASWLMATLAPGADQVALVQTAGALPFFFFSLLAGALADTRDRRTIMLVSQAATLLASAALAVVALVGQVTPSLLLAFTFLISCGAALFAPAWQASIGDQVPRHQIAPAVMANAVGFNVARSVGPALGGVIVAAAGAAAAFVINTVSYLGIIATLLWWRPTRVRSELPPEPLVPAIDAGIRYIRLSPHLVAIMLRCILFTLPIAAVPALMPVVARDLLGGGAPTYGLLLGGFGIGAMMGALGSAELRNRFSADGLLRVLAVVACVAMVIIGQSRWMAVTLAAHVLAGSVWTLGFANFNIAVQLSSPRWVTGRMLAHYQTISFAAIALGSWLWGVAAHAEGLREALTVAGVVALFPLAVARWLPVSIPQLGALDPRERGAIAPPSVEIHAASGPVVVTIEYRVPAANAVEFVAVINELGRVRRRDGARSWSICQDIDEPDLWVERFEHPTWMDYLRWRGRRTESDRAMRARIDPLIDTSRILVRRLVERPAGADPLGTVSPPTPDRAVAGRERGPHGDLPA